MKTVIAIDGPAASGKSTVAKELADRLGFAFVSTGQVYRAAAWLALKNGINVHDAYAVETVVSSADWHCLLKGNRSMISINDHALSDEEMTSPEVNAIVSLVASYPGVRDFLLERQRDYARVTDIVVEGRDMGTQVFPHTPYKFFITAREEIRRQRREQQGIRGDDVGERDKLDSTRKTAPLWPAPDANTIDTSELTITQVVELILKELKELELPAAITHLDE